VFAKEEGCTVEWSKIWSIAPIPFHPELMALCDAAIRVTAGSSEQLPSGPLHDAAEVAQLGVPTAMMFVQSRNGLSHNKAEDTAREHLVLAVEALGRLADAVTLWILDQP
jgi:N-carbamoyl-L-amino-acid hydrolase